MVDPNHFHIPQTTGGQGSPGCELAGHPPKMVWGWGLAPDSGAYTWPYTYIYDHIWPYIGHDPAHGQVLGYGDRHGSNITMAKAQAMVKAMAWPQPWSHPWPWPGGLTVNIYTSRFVHSGRH